MAFSREVGGMTGSSRRWLCRAAFVFVMALPTVAMILWGAVAHASRRAAQWRGEVEQQVLENLGLAARIERVSWQGSQLCLHGVTLHDPETSQLVAQVDNVRATARGSQGWSIHLTYPRVAAGQLPRLISPLYDRLRHRRGPLEWSGLLTAQYVTLEDELQAVSCPEVECQFGSGANASVAGIKLLIEGVTTTEPLQVRLKRDRRPQHPETTIMVDTRKQAIPVRLLRLLVPQLALLGDHCYVRGELHLRHTDQQWKVERLTGQCTGVDLYQLVSENFPHHHLSGIAKVDIEHAEFEEGRATRVEGTLFVDRGTISRSLLQAMADHLGYQLSESARQAGKDRWEYENLRLWFRLADGSLDTGGRSGDGGEVLWSDNHALLRKERSSVPVASFIRMLVPDSQHQVPATRQTLWLASLLPIPPVEKPQQSSIAPSAPTIRLKDESRQR